MKKVYLNYGINVAMYSGPYIVWFSAAAVE